MALLTLKTDDSSFSLEIGKEQHVKGAQISVYAGGNDFCTGKSVYEADKGFIILEALPNVESQWGQSNWSTSLTARDANVETIEKVNSIFEELMSSASSKNDEKNQQMSQWVKKQILDYYFKYSSSNARFEVTVTCKSEEIRIPLPWPLNPKIDTHTANLKMYFTFRTLKLITPEELVLVHDFMSSAIEKGLLIDYEYAEVDDV